MTNSFNQGTCTKQISILIPAYNPDHHLLQLIKDLIGSGFNSIIVVNDGSAASCSPIFDAIAEMAQCRLLHHAVNLGKGRAIKTGLNYLLVHDPDTCGVVTCDADGQHLVGDIEKVAHVLKNNPENLVLGVRRFDTDVPLRSKLGNAITRGIFYLLVGKYLTDTQTGLRGIPVSFMPLLMRLEGEEYEYEMNMLIATKNLGLAVVEETINTVYLENNKSSHFNPIIDSMKIYFVLFRFTMTSLLSAVIDNSVFIVVFGLSSNILASQAVARLLATLYNYIAVRKIVFYSKERTAKTLPKYLALVCVSGAVSYLLINVLISLTPLTVIAAKICVETVIFLANFAIQRDFVFSRNKGNTDEFVAGK